MKAMATKPCFVNSRYQSVGDIFEVSPADFSESSMKLLEEEPAKAAKKKATKKKADDVTDGDGA